MTAASLRDETDLVRRAAAGDTDAFTTLHRIHRGTVQAVVRSTVRRGAEAPDHDDVVQEVFVTAWQRLGTLHQPESFRPWLAQIARRLVLDQARHRRRRPNLDSDDDLALARAPDRAPGPDQVVELMDLAVRIRHGIDTLSPRDATAIGLSVGLGLGPTEIAETLGITPNNAKVVLHRARVRLREAVHAVA